MFESIKKIFIDYLNGIESAIVEQSIMFDSTALIDLHPNKYGQVFVGSCNTVIVLSNEVCVSNKTEGLNLSVFNMITGINGSKTLTKHISCQCR